jgi:hypothetical protein
MSPNKMAVYGRVPHSSFVLGAYNSPEMVGKKCNSSVGALYVHPSVFGVVALPCLRGSRGLSCMFRQQLGRSRRDNQVPGVPGPVLCHTKRDDVRPKKWVLSTFFVTLRMRDLAGKGSLGSLGSLLPFVKST